MRAACATLLSLFGCSLPLSLSAIDNLTSLFFNEKLQLLTILSFLEVSNHVFLLVGVKIQRTSQFADRAARLNEAFLVARRVPLLRTSAGAVLPWSMVQER